MAVSLKTHTTNHDPSSLHSAFDWKRISHLLLLSRAIDAIEETSLVPNKKIFNQFSARGHDFAQVLLGSLLNDPNDGASGYYRSRPFVLSLGLSAEDALAAPLAKSGGYSDGRDIGVVCNFGKGSRASLLPMSGGVGAQYTPVAGWAQAIDYHASQLNDKRWQSAIAVSLGGDASMSTNGFWSALNIATTNKLPYLFYVEDNGYGISVPSSVQTPGGDQVANLAAYSNLTIIDGDGADPIQTPALIKAAVDYTRQHQGPCLLRLRVPRLCGHTFQDTQAYKSDAYLHDEAARDPLPKLKKQVLASGILSESDWLALEQKVNNEVTIALSRAESRADPDPSKIKRYVYAEHNSLGTPEPPLKGGLDPADTHYPPTTDQANTQGSRINMLTAIRMTLDHEMDINPKMLVFGEDVGPKGGVHGATLGLHDKHGNARVFDTSLSEEGIIGRSVGMAVAGLLPVPEIQFRKYAEPAAEQITDAGTMRWRTANQFACPMVVRIPGGFAKRGDPWHSMCDEVEWAHKVGWQCAVPSNATDAVGLLRFALRDHNPTIFFEHRNLLDAASARRPYPGDDYCIPFGQANTLIHGNRLSLICWGAMVERCVSAAEALEQDIEVIDLRTIQPWDSTALIESVNRTGRALIVHEDNKTAGFGAEIAATLATECFWNLDAPIERLAMPDVPSPHNIDLLNYVLPSVTTIKSTLTKLLAI